VISGPFQRSLRFDSAALSGGRHVKVKLIFSFSHQEVSHRVALVQWLDEVEEESPVRLPQFAVSNDFAVRFFIKSKIKS